MLAKVIPDRGAAPADLGFAARIGYICAKARQIELRHLAGGWIHAADQMRCIAGLNPRKSRPCRHVVLSWSPLERPTDAEMIAEARRMLRDLGATDHQAVIALHRDRPHPHVHIILNLIHPLTGRTLDLRHDYMRLERACRRIEQEMGWPADRGRYDVEIIEDELLLRPRAPEDWLRRRRDREAGMRRETAAMRGHERRTGFRPLHLRYCADRLQLITAALDGAGSWQQVHEIMQAAGWAYRPHGSGARIVSRLDATWAIPASHMGARFSLRRMQDWLGVFAAQVGDRLGQAARALRVALRQSGSADDRNRIPLPDPDILEPLFQEQSVRQRQGRAARQAAAELRERQAAERHAVHQHLGSRRGAVPTLIRSMILRQHREDRRLLRASQPRQDPLPLATHLLAADSPDYRLSLQYRLPARRNTADGTPAVQDHTACRQAWALAGMAHETPAPECRLGRLLVLHAEDLRFTDAATMLVAHRDTHGGICGFSRIDLDRSHVAPGPAPGGREGLVLIGARNAWRCRIVPDLRSAIVTAIMSAADPALILVAPGEATAERQARIDQLLAGRIVEIVLPKPSLQAPDSIRLLRRYPEARVITFDSDVMLKVFGPAASRLHGLAPMHS